MTRRRGSDCAARASVSLFGLTPSSAGAGDKELLTCSVKYLRADKMAWLTGYPRENIPWFPTVDRAKSVKCAMCLNCGRNVYGWTKEGARVERPYRCVVGCSTCANLRQGAAITFPDIRVVREINQRAAIWRKV